MANDNPTGDGPATALTIPPAHAAFLRRSTAACLDGLEGDLSLLRNRHPRLEEARLEADAYRRLLIGLDSGQIIPDADLLHVVAEMTKETDESNEYKRIALEHDALHGLLAQISGPEEVAT